MTNLHINFDGVIYLFFLLITLLKTYSYKLSGNKHRVITPIFLIIFFILNNLSDNLSYYLLDSYWSFLILLFLFGYTFIFFLFHDQYKNITVLFITYFFLEINLKAFLNMLFMIFSIKLFNVSIPTYLIYLINCFVLFVVSIFFQKRPLRANIQFPNEYWQIIILFPIITGIFSQFFLNKSLPSDSAFLLNLSLRVLIIVTLVLSYYLSYIITFTYDNFIKTLNINKKLELQMDSINRSVSMVEQIRRDKHEMKNVYFYIHTQLHSKNYEELNEFVNSKLLHRYDRLEEFNTGNYILDCLLTQKINEARDSSINTYADIMIPSNLPLDENDLCGLLINLLDNAIDASKEVETPDIQITIKMVKSYLSIQVKNKTTTDVLSTNPHLFSTKKNANEHGLGLKIVQTIVDKNNGIKKIYMQSGYFCVDVLLKVSGNYI